MEHKVLGEIEIIHSTRNKHVNIRWKNNIYIVTCPINSKIKDITKIIEDNVDKLLVLRDKAITHQKNEIAQKTYQVQKENKLFEVKIKQNELSNDYFTFKDDILLFSFKKSTQFNSPYIISSIETIFNETMLKSALKFFDDATSRLAQKHNFKYSNISVKKMISKWGYCTSKKELCFSVYAIKLPMHLIEYIILHELCHTIHMNHKLEFWQKLSNVLGSDSKTVRKELKGIQTKWDGANIDELLEVY